MWWNGWNYKETYLTELLHFSTKPFTKFIQIENYSVFLSLINVDLRDQNRLNLGLSKLNSSNKRHAETEHSHTAH